MATTAAKKEPQLEVFLNGFQELIKAATERSLELATDEDEKNVIKPFSLTLVNQATELNNFIRASTKKISKQQSSEIDKLLSVTSGVSLVESAKGILPSLGSVVGKLGFSRIVEMIKKIIRAIFDLLPIKLPKWIDSLIDLIDEILNSILSVGSSKLATMLSVQEQNYLAELTELAKLQQANLFKYQDNDDDDT